MTRGIRVTFLSGLSLLSWGLPIHAIAAQPVFRSVTGTVFDGRDRPIPLATFTANGRAVATADDSGRFQIRFSHRDRVVIDVRRVGYMPTRVTLSAGGDTNLSVLMLPNVRELPGIAIEAERAKPAAIEGFERRMRERSRGAGTGTFITAKEIEQMYPTRTTQVVERVPSMVVRRVGADRYVIYGKLVNGGECAATIFLDGIRINGSGDRTMGRDRRGNAIIARDAMPVLIDDYVIPNDLAGVEIYPRGLLAPPQYGPADPSAARCAIVLFWTKHAG